MVVDVLFLPHRMVHNRTKVKVRLEVPKTQGIGLTPEHKLKYP